MRSTYSRQYSKQTPEGKVTMFRTRREDFTGRKRQHKDHFLSVPNMMHKLISIKQPLNLVRSWVPILLSHRKSIASLQEEEKRKKEKKKRRRRRTFAMHEPFIDHCTQISSSSWSCRLSLWKTWSWWCPVRCSSFISQLLSSVLPEWACSYELISCLLPDVTVSWLKILQYPNLWNKPSGHPEFESYFCHFSFFFCPPKTCLHPFCYYLQASELFCDLFYFWFLASWSCCDSLFFCHSPGDFDDTSFGGAVAAASRASLDPARYRCRGGAPTNCPPTSGSALCAPVPSRAAQLSPPNVSSSQSPLAFSMLVALTNSFFFFFFFLGVCCQSFQARSWARTKRNQTKIWPEKALTNLASSKADARRRTRLELLQFSAQVSLSMDRLLPVVLSFRSRWRRRDGCASGNRSMCSVSVAWLSGNDKHRSSVGLDFGLWTGRSRFPRGRLGLASGERRKRRVKWKANSIT